LFSSYCIAIDVIEARHIRAVRRIPCGPSTTAPWENLDVA
jgi:hypothetical protein